ncbi:MAG: ribonuclease HII [Chloroflexi bacterium]|nr:ribonuclease HII [Chloroflexota bacterium]
MSRSSAIRIQYPNIDLESELWEQGYGTIAGLDEAGRGAWAGPLYAAAVVLPADAHVMDVLAGVKDSKKMTAKQRERWKDCIKAVSLDWAIGSADPHEIDQLGIAAANRTAMQRAIQQLHYPPDYLLIDYIQLPDCQLPQTNLPKGDGLSLSIAAASVLAKTARDALLIDLDKRYPRYGFAQHKGYGTARHRAALQAGGACEIHRMSFAPMKFMQG